MGLRKARRVFVEMADRNMVSWNSLVAGYGRCWDVDRTWGIFYEMPERNVVSWEIMSAGCVQSGSCKQAIYICLVRCQGLGWNYTGDVHGCFVSLC